MPPDIQPFRRGKYQRVVIGCTKAKEEAGSGRDELSCQLNLFQSRAVKHLDRTVVAQTFLYGIGYQRMILFQARKFLRMSMQGQNGVAQHV